MLRAAAAAAGLSAAAFLLPAVAVKSGTHDVAETPAPSGCMSPRPLPSTLYVADVGQSAGLTADEQLVFASLQGIVNRTSPRIYLEGTITDTTSAAWLAKGAVPIPTQTVQPYDLLRLFQSSVRGLVVWDPALTLDTQNVATTIAGLNDLLPVSPFLAERLEALPYGFKVAIDLRGEHFANREAAYRWALSHYRSSTRVMGWLGGDWHGLRDLLVACNAFVFQANPEIDAGVVQSILVAFPAGTPVFGYPCLGDSISKASGVPVCEPYGVGEISRAGDFLIPADLSENLTVHSAFSPTQQRPAWDDSIQQPDPTKTYVTFVISDGDNVGYNEGFLLEHHWGEAAHGAIPIGISVSPWLGVYAPRLYAYYVQTMTANDALVSGPSGAGYMYPSVNPGLQGYLAQTKKLFDVDGLRAVWILDNGYAYSPSPLSVDEYVKALAPSGIFADYFGWVTPNPPAVSFDRGTPVMHGVWGSCVANTIDRIKAAASTYPGRPAFVFVALNTWQMGFDQAKHVMSQLGPGYTAARPDRFIGLLKGAGLPVGTRPPEPAAPSFVQPACAP